MSITKLDNGRYKVRWRPRGTTGPYRARTFDYFGDADAFHTEIKRKQQLGGVLNVKRGTTTLSEYIETYWRIHATPNLAATTRDAYARSWRAHLEHRLGDRELREITPKVIRRLIADLGQAGVGAAAQRKALAVLQSILALAVVDEELDVNPVALVRKPRYERARQPVLFLPADVEGVLATLDRPAHRALIAVLAYAGPRPEEALRLRVRDVGAESIHFTDTKRHAERWTPLLPNLRSDLKHYLLETGLRAGAPLFPAGDGGHMHLGDWRNWRTRVWNGWHGGTQPKAPRAHCRHTKATQAGLAVCADCGATRRTAPGTRPRDLRSSYITLQVYAGVPLTTIAKWCGTSIQMLERHYAGVIENWDGQQVPADEQITRARQQLARHARGAAP